VAARPRNPGRRWAGQVQALAPSEAHDHSRLACRPGFQGCAPVRFTPPLAFLNTWLVMERRERAEALSAAAQPQATAALQA
jgi:hypothetical protein